MTTITYDDLLAAYLDEPTAERRSELFRAIRNARGFTTHLDFRSIDQHLKNGSYAAAAAALAALMPGAYLSASAHGRLSTALAGLGESEAAEREKQFAKAALRVIRSTGDGSARAPWRVLRVNDEYDLLAALGKTSRAQSLVELDGRRIDRHECTDGDVLHFDASGLLGA